MNESVDILKLLGHFAVIPLWFGAPIIIIWKIIDLWLNSSLEQKDKISLIITATLLCIIVITASIYGSTDSTDTLCGLIFITTILHFSFKGLRAQGGYKADYLAGKKVEAFILGFSTAWKSKFHWGMWVILASLSYGIFI